MEIGFIGVGRMGKAMARNLIKAGHQVRAWDTSAAALQALSADGAAVARSVGDAFRGDAVISMLPNDDAMREVFLDGGVIDAGGAKVHVNMATASVEMARELAARHAEHGIAYIAATVWGRPDVAAAGKLAIVAAGEPHAIAKVQPLFDVLGQKTYNVGTDPSRANVAKIAGNPAPSRGSPRPPLWCGRTGCRRRTCSTHHHLALQRPRLSRLRRHDRQAAI
jgi:3-hydroxyisobutyrate dehydrogenase-like beta-hydroxyacid dehydrogenase